MYYILRSCYIMLIIPDITCYCSRVFDSIDFKAILRTPASLSLFSKSSTLLRDHHMVVCHSFLFGFGKVYSFWL